MPVAHRHASFAFAVLLVTAGCDAEPAVPKLPTVSVTIGSKQYTLEVAADEPSREHGLMERDPIADDHGMVFVFPDERPRAFWMHHTRFPLDILYVDAKGTVVSVHRMRAYDESTTSRGGPAMYAIELRAGRAEACGVKAGDKIVLPTDLKANG